MGKRTAHLLSGCVFLLVFAPALAVAGVRHFTFLYETTTTAPGSIEVENWVTFRTGKDGDRFWQVDFRHELEFGITNRFQLSVYAADWNYHSDFRDATDGFSFSASAVEGVYNLTNPVIDPVGISFYEEIKAGDRFFESESKLIAQKNFGRLIVAYNATLEATWQNEGLAQREGEFQQAFGVSYELAARLSVGLEMLHEIIFANWNSADSIQNFFIGPNISVRQGRWFATATVLAQATQTADEPDVQLRTVMGFAF